MCVCLSQGVPSLKVRQVPPTCRNNHNFRTICYPCMARMKVSKILLKVAYLGLLKNVKKLNENQWVNRQGKAVYVCVTTFFNLILAIFEPIHKVWMMNILSKFQNNQIKMHKLITLTKEHRQTCVIEMTVVLIKNPITFSCVTHQVVWKRRIRILDSPFHQHINERSIFRYTVTFWSCFHQLLS